MTFKLVVSVLMATLLVACGEKHNSTGPSSYEPTANTPTPGPSSTPTPSSSPTTSSTICLVDDMAVPLPTATVGFTGGQTVSVDATGCVGVPSGQAVVWAEAPGFRQLTDFPLQREDVPLSQGTYALWPQTGYLEQLEEYDGTYSQIGLPFGGIRPKSGVYTVSLPGEMVGASSTTDIQAYESALNALLLDASAQSSNKVVFQTTTVSSANIKIVVDAGMSWAGFFQPTISGHYITGGTLRIYSLDALINNPETIRHELGHFLGVNHTLDSPRRLMNRGTINNGFATEPEIIHFRMRFLRSPGFDARKG